MSDYDHSIQRFKDAENQLAKALGRIEELKAAVHEALTVLENPGLSCVSDRKGIMGEQRIVQAPNTLEASRWPRIEDVDVALRDYQKAISARGAAFGALSHEDKQLVFGVRH